MSALDGYSVRPLGRIDDGTASREHADSYIGAAGYAAPDDPRINVGLAQAEAFLVIASAIDRLSDTIREVFQPAVQPEPPYGETPPPYDPGLQPYDPGWEHAPPGGG